MLPVECFDISPNGNKWNDSDGDQYDCEWYSIGGNCATYGDLSPNYGLTASQACCACGGGSETLSPTYSPTTSPSHDPTATPTKSPTPNPTVIVPTASQTTTGPPSKIPTPPPVVCFDIKPNGDDCRDSNCNNYGSGSANFGLTANQACCACGGGSGTESPTKSPTKSPSKSPTQTPTGYDDPADDVPCPCYDGAAVEAAVAAIVSGDPNIDYDSSSSCTGMTEMDGIHYSDTSGGYLIMMGYGFFNFGTWECNDGDQFFAPLTEAQGQSCKDIILQKCNQHKKQLNKAGL